MRPFETISVFIAIVAASGYLNARLFRLPGVVGVAAVGFVLSLGLLVATPWVPGLGAAAKGFVGALDIKALLFHGLLGLLLFAGSMSADISGMRRHKLTIFLLATAGVVLSTLVIGCGLYWITRPFGIGIDLAGCLLFGALISPTDPLTVLSILRKVGVSKDLEAQMAGESLLNDGAAIVLFLVILGVHTSGQVPEVSQVAILFLREVVGGVLFGIGLGMFGLFLLKDIDDYPVEILITLTLATGGFALAEALHVSEPLAIVTAGLVVGHRGRKYYMSETTKDHMRSFWTLMDELLNLALFALVGFELMALDVGAYTWGLASVAVPLVLAGRAVSVALPSRILSALGRKTEGAVSVMTWGGLRGAISIAMALSLPDLPGKDFILAATYAVVMFSLLGQATSLEWFLKKSIRP